MPVDFVASHDLIVLLLKCGTVSDIYSTYIFIKLDHQTFRKFGQIHGGQKLEHRVKQTPKWIKTTIQPASG